MTIMSKPPGNDSPPMVSVCVQTYQHVHYIRRCLDSILEQRTNFGFEILLGEDASTDGTREICIEYSNQNTDKIRLFLLDRKNVVYLNGRATGRYNLINNLKKSNGKYIAHCQGDDYWNDPDKLQKQVDFLETHDDHAICYHNMRIADEHGNLIDRWKMDPVLLGQMDPESFYSRVVLPMGACLTRAPNHPFPPQMWTVVNADTFLLGLIGQYGRAAYLNDINDAVAHEHGGGIWTSQSIVQRCYAIIETFEAFLDTIDSKFHAEIREIINHRYRTLVRQSVKTGRPLTILAALRRFARHVNYNPLKVGLLLKSGNA